MPDEPLPDDAAGLRAANARLRAVVEARAAEIAGLRAELDGERELRRRMELRLAELERRLGMDSSDSGTPSSKERIGAKEARRARQQSERERRKDRKPGDLGSPRLDDRPQPRVRSAQPRGIIRQGLIRHAPQAPTPTVTRQIDKRRNRNRRSLRLKAQAAASTDIMPRPPSSRGESHPPALTDPYVTVSRYTALVVLITRLAVLTESRPSGRRTGAARPQPAPTPYGLSSVSAVACTSSASTASGNC